MSARKPALVPQWRQAWRWYSVNCPALAVALLGAWAALPEKLQDSFSPLQLKAFAITMIVLGIGGRLIDQSKKPKAEPEQTNAE